MLELDSRKHIGVRVSVSFIMTFVICFLIHLKYGIHNYLKKFNVQMVLNYFSILTFSFNIIGEF